MTRFRPTRAGLINIWDYVDEEFVFADGRLVLRGHNGSGKTKALEVLFPFILDGVADARRLDPFSGENRTMKSNLLYRGQDSEYGFVWMEFATGATAHADAVTLIIALHAHKDKPAASTSFFVARKRVGIDFGLLTADSRPLTERQLENILGSECCFDSATAYREAIDTALFGLGRQRYSQLVDLLLALRRPLLAKDLDPVKVSETLTAVLSPISEELIGQAARDFDNLAAVQRLVEDLTAADTSASVFLDVYRDYLALEARARLNRLNERTQQTTRHATALRKTSLEITRATSAEEQACARREDAEQRKNTLDAQLSGLKRSDAYLSQDQLVRLRDQVTAGERELRDRHDAHTKAGRHLTDLATEADDLGADLQRQRATAARQAAEQAQAAQAAGIDDSDTDLQTAKARAATRRDDVDQVRARLADVSAAVTGQQTASDALAAADSKLHDATQACRRAEDVRDQAREQTQRKLQEWSARWTAEPPDTTPTVCAADVAALNQALAATVDCGQTTSLPSMFADLTDERRTNLVSDQTRIGIEHDQLAGELDTLREERQQIAAQHDDAPALAATRSSDRSQRPGGPLWRLVRFTDTVSDAEAAKLEAALDAAGLLTAWIHPDSAYTDTAYHHTDHDTYLRPLPPHDRPTGPTLTSVLVPEDQDHVPAQVITDILACIAVSPTLQPTSASPAVSTRGQFTYGIQLGAYGKDTPEFIGATYRAARRASRIADYDRRITDLNRRLEELQRRQQQVKDHLGHLWQARQELPPTTPILSALTDIASTSALLAQARTEQSDTAQRLDIATAETDAARRRLRHTAAERDLPAEPGPVDLIAQAINDYLQAAQQLAATRSAIKTMAEEVSRRNDMINQLRADHAEEAGRLEEKATTQLRLTEELSGLEQRLSAPLTQVLNRIEKAEADLHTANQDRDSADQQAGQEHDARITAQSAYEHCEQFLLDAVTALLEAAHPLAAFTGPDLRPLTGITATCSWPHTSQWTEPAQATQQLIAQLIANTPAQEISEDTAQDVGPPDSVIVERAVHSLIPGDAAQLITLLDNATSGRPAGENARKAIRQRLSDALKDFNETLTSCDEDYRLDWQPGDTVIAVHVYDADGRHPVADFARRVAERNEEQKFLLEERERTVLEDELLTELAQQVFDRVYIARDLVKGMDADTRSRPMSNGTTVGIRWVTSDKITDLQREVSDLLGYQHAGPDQLARLRQLLRQMLREYRTAHPRDTYKEALSAVLDYRTWRAFELRLHVPGQEEVKLSRKEHSRMSGGEKSAAIHLPLFAAANAIYTSASPTCPRMIALDEAFAGIDDRYTPDLLGLTVQYGLDAFMTGHDLWVRYPTVPAAAHYDMHSDKLSHTVSAMLILWDGTELLDAGAGYSGNEELAADLLGFTPTRRAPAGDGVLSDLDALDSQATEHDTDGIDQNSEQGAAV